MSGHEAGSEVYDDAYAKGGPGGAWALPYRHSCYFPLFRAVLSRVRRSRARNVLEVGCGSGAFAHYLMDAGIAAYRGFDFSPVAVEQARKRTGRPGCFSVADARSDDPYTQPYDAIVCTEVLEHISADREVVGRWAPGTVCVCSVPDFDADDHVRFFRSEAEVRERYGDLIDIESVAKVRQPELSDISLGSYLRAIRWNRDRPGKLLQILGIGGRDRASHWYVFTGRRQDAKAGKPECAGLGSERHGDTRGPVGEDR